MTCQFANSYTLYDSTFCIT